MAAKKKGPAKGGGGGKGKGKGKTPQPPIPAPPVPAARDPYQQPSYDLTYTPSVESQINQPYQDVIAAGALGALPGVFGNIGGQQHYADIYGGTGAATLGQYGQLMGVNPAIQAGWQKELQDIQAGKADFDPFLTQQFNDQERVLRDQLRRNLGPDYETSSAGIEALGKFQQNKTTTLGSAQFQRGQQLEAALQNSYGNLANQAAGFQNIYGQRAQDIYNQSMGLRNYQLGGATNILNQAATTQDLYAGVPKTMGQFGEAMSGLSANEVSAQSPYQRDRFAKLQNAQMTPSEGQMWGMMASQGGDRWAKIGSSIGSMGGGAAQAGSQAGGG